jgi:hypothetical protein
VRQSYYAKSRCMPSDFARIGTVPAANGVYPSGTDRVESLIVVFVVVFSCLLLFDCRSKSLYIPLNGFC